MAVFTSCKLSVPAIVDTENCLTTDAGSDVTETDNAASLSDETESVLTSCNTPTSDLGEREVSYITAASAATAAALIIRGAAGRASFLVCFSSR